ncbi:MAG: limonene-1,2-epoxide hydrolase [Chloroflexi bacterium]|nr:limonene-1,2-epoxide hydrolase [Chloroflexota bacterium]MXX79827.1 limonene-1,2-epoxide hydrolase [Chloroflexota bacterium]MYB21617.1 limonene-1,2-epoxide hydrolase [Chloroflexota bacterium]MYD16698.1 limonene-1,2-epoxide hydrolase [Chloroflexota bacterium]MYF23647.1 limonene-1,2-epoxide hydrolase [Chloroflexota bacterium]
MSDAASIVNAFMAEFDAEHPDADKLASYFTDDAVYHNMPMAPAEGIEAVKAALTGVSQMTSKGWEVVHQAVNGNVVLNERIDRFEMGGNAVDVLVCGVFEIRDGKIARWRDYFDMASFQKQMPGG